MIAFYYLPTDRVFRTNDDETSPADDPVDEVDLELGVCPVLHTICYTSKQAMAR